MDFAHYGGAMVPRLLRAAGDAALMRLDLAALALASSAATAPSSTSLGAAPAELCLSPVQAALFAGLLLLGFVIAVASEIGRAHV